jgi:hypothetical protein
MSAARGPSKRKAWTLQQKWFVIQLREKEPTKRLIEVALA